MYKRVNLSDHVNKKKIVDVNLSDHVHNFIETQTRLWMFKK